MAKGYKQQQDIHHVNKKSLIALSKNPDFHDQMKHINTRYHFIIECIIKKEVQLNFTKSQYQIVNIFIKPLNFEDFKRLRMLLIVTNQV